MSDFDPHNASGSKDKDLEGIIRPQELEDFTGQREIVSNLEVYIKAAKMRGEALDHTLFHFVSFSRRLFITTLTLEQAIRADAHMGVICQWAPKR